MLNEFCVSVELLRSFTCWLFGEVGSQLKGSTGLAAVSVFCFFDWVGCLFVLTVARRKVRLVVRFLLPYCCRWVRFTFRFALIRICVTHNCSENTCSFFIFLDWLYQIWFEIKWNPCADFDLDKVRKVRKKKFHFQNLVWSFKSFFHLNSRRVSLEQNQIGANRRNRRPIGAIGAQSAPMLSMRNLFEFTLENHLRIFLR